MTDEEVLKEEETFISNEERKAKKYKSYKKGRKKLVSTSKMVCEYC